MSYSTCNRGEIKKACKITEISRKGDGIWRNYDGLVVFVPGTRIGDVVDIRIVHRGQRMAVGEVIKPDE